MKFALFIFIAISALIIAVLLGWLFYFWPTSWPDSKLMVSPAQIEQLKQFRSEVKFHPDSKTFYPGTRNEVLRLSLENFVNGVIDLIIPTIDQHPQKSSVLSIFKASLLSLDKLDSEEKDQLLHYFNRIMQILGVQSSNELLNVWRYGFPYGWAA
jgi:hypothetical protein